MKATVSGMAALAAFGITHGEGYAVWADFESRIQYAYYTEDARALANLAELLAARTEADSWKDYYQALAHYHYASMPNAPQPARGGAAEKCIVAAERAAQTQLRSRKSDGSRPAANTAGPENIAEAAVLQSACFDLLSAMKPVRAPLATARARKRLSEALQLSPANPRALLIEASAQSGAEAEKTLSDALLRFERERQSASSLPSWGAAEGYLALGRLKFERGDVLGARDALERALLIAPEFAAARQLLVRVTTG